MAPLFLKTVTNLRACEEHLRTCKADRSDGPPIEPVRTRPWGQVHGRPGNGTFQLEVYSPRFSGDARQGAPSWYAMMELQAPYRHALSTISAVLVQRPSGIRSRVRGGLTHSSVVTRYVRVA